MKHLILIIIIISSLFIITGCKDNDEESISINEIETIELNSDNELVITFKDGSDMNLGIADSNDGEDGLSAYEIYKQFYSGYGGTEEEWTSEVDSGTLILTINLELNGGTLSQSDEESFTVYKGENVTLPEPTLLGYSFEGWYTDSTYDTSYETSYVNTNDLTLYAKWELDMNQVSNELIQDRDALLQDIDLNHVSSDLNLPTVGENGSQITWHSDNDAIISNDGTITLPPTNEEYVTVNLTARLTLNEITIEKTFIIKVVNNDTITYALNAEIDEEVTFSGVVVGYGDGNYLNRGVVYVYSPEEGKSIYLFGVNGQAIPKVGQKITVTGFRGEYSGLPQVVSYDFEVLEENIDVIQYYETVTIEDILNNPGDPITQDGYLLKPVKIENVVVSSQPNSNGITYFTDETGTIGVYRFGYIINSNVEYGDVVDLYACVSAYNFGGDSETIQLHSTYSNSFPTLRIVEDLTD